MSKLSNWIMRGYTPLYAPHNNRKRTRGRNYLYRKGADGKIRKIWPNMDKL